MAEPTFDTIEYYDKEKLSRVDYRPPRTGWMARSLTLVEQTDR